MNSFTSHRQTDFYYVMDVVHTMNSYKNYIFVTLIAYCGFVLQKFRESIMSEMMKCGEQSKYDLLTKALGKIRVHFTFHIHLTFKSIFSKIVYHDFFF